FVGCGAGNPPTNSQSGSTVGASATNAVSLGSQLGYAWMTADATLRPILGVPGGSRFGPSAVAARTYTSGAASSITQVALLEDRTGALLLQHLDGGAPTGLASGLPASRIVFSSGGTSVVAYASGG